MIEIQDEHFSLKTAREVHEICTPFFKETGITYFNYIRHYDNGCFAFITSNGEWSQYFCNKGYATTKGNVELKPGVRLWGSDTSLTLAAKEARELFNIAHRYDIIERGENCYNMFAFGSQVNNPQIVDYYINNLHALKRFMLYFKDKAAPLIKGGTKKENQVYIKEFEEYGKLKLLPLQSKSSLPGPVKRFSLNTQAGNVSLSYDELICMLLVLKGNTAEQMAKTLKLSERTVQTMLVSNKEKFKCHTLEELFDSAWKSGIADLLDPVTFKAMLSSS